MTVSRAAFGYVFKDHVTSEIPEQTTRHYFYGEGINKPAVVRVGEFYNVIYADA